MAGESESDTQSCLFLYFSPFSPPQFVGGKGASACIVEESEVDMATKTTTTYTRNVNFNKLMTVVEKAIYTVSPENKEWLETRLILHVYIYDCVQLLQ